MLKEGPLNLKRKPQLPSFWQSSQCGLQKATFFDFASDLQSL
jgi:hypothetical protein